MSNIFKILSTWVKEGIITVPQVILLFINGYFYVFVESNNFLIMSILLTFSIFALQAVRKRFSMLFPVNGFALNKRTDDIDTYYLRFVISLSLFFLFLGMFPNTFKLLLGLVTTFSLLICAIIFIIIAPGIFYFLSNWIDNRIVQKLMNIEYIKDIICPFSTETHFAHEIRKVIKPDLGEIRIICTVCNPEKEWKRSRSLNIGG